MFVDEDMAVDYHQGGPEPAHCGQHPGEGEGPLVSAQIVNGAADQEALTQTQEILGNYSSKTHLISVTIPSYQRCNGGHKGTAPNYDYPGSAIS